MRKKVLMLAKRFFSIDHLLAKEKSKSSIQPNTVKTLADYIDDDTVKYRFKHRLEDFWEKFKS